MYGNICESSSKDICLYSYYSNTCQNSGKIQLNVCTVQSNTKYQINSTQIHAYKTLPQANIEQKKICSSYSTCTCTVLHQIMTHTKYKFLTKLIFKKFPCKINVKNYTSKRRF